MNSGERLLKALSHQEPDRVPIDLGSIVTGITVTANDSLQSALGWQADAPVVVDRVQQLARPGEELLQRLEVDTRYLYARSARDWHDVELPDHVYEDQFGIRRKAAFDADGRLLYYDFVRHPLAEAESVADLAKYRWPNPHDPARYEGLEEEARTLTEQTGCGVIVNVIGSIFEFAWYLRGFERFFEDLILRPALAEALLDAMLEYQIAQFDQLLSRVGPYVSVVMTGTDLGTQRGPLISPERYRRVVWPRYLKLWQFIRGKTEAKIFYHSCGGIVPLIPFLINGGVDAIHPVQPMAAGMGDRRRLKREFGRDITFWGGFDQQHVLPFGTPNQVREEARRLLDDFMPGGGFVFAAGHNIQAGVPPENVLALFETVIEYGRYR
jgi:uroporphyrinogen decarboxylase